MDDRYFQPIIYQPSTGTTLKDVLERRFERNFINAKASDCFLILSTYCGLISPEEIVTYFRFVSYDQAVDNLYRLNSSGKMVRVTLYHQKTKTNDGRTSVVFGLSKSGYDYVKKMFRPELPGYRKMSEKYACHDYGVSWNIMALIANSFLPTLGKVESELLFDNKGRRADRPVNDGLRIDSVVEVGGDTLYIEEDRGTEDNITLRDKFKVYGFQGYNLAKNNTLIVLSMKLPFKAPMSHNNIRHGKNVRYSVKHLEAVLKLAEQYPDLAKQSYDDTYEFRFLHEAIATGAIPSSPLTELSEQLWQEVEPMGYTKYNDATSTDPYFFSCTYYIKQHLDGIKKYTSPVYFYEYGKLQDEFCIRKRNALVENILAGGIYKKSEVDDIAPDISFYLDGFRLFMGPTYMIDRVYFYALYEHTPFKEIMGETLKQYIPELDANSYKPYYVIRYDSPLKRKDAPVNSFLMLNSYIAGNWMVFVENLAYDVSAAVRVKAASLCLNIRPTEGAHKVLIVCLVRDFNEARYFYDLLNLDSVPLRADAHLRILFLDVCHCLEWVDPSNNERLMFECIFREDSPMYGIMPDGRKKEL